MKLRRQKTILAIMIEPDGLQICRVRTRAGKPEPAGHWRVPVSAESLRNRPAHAAEKIRRHLAGTGIKREACSITLPAAWAFTFSLEAKNQSPGVDLDDYVETEAEKYCPVNLADLSYAIVHRPESDTIFFVGVPLECVSAIESAFRAAGLTPVDMTLQGQPLVDANPGFDGVVLLYGDSWSSIIAAQSGDVVAARSLTWRHGEDARREIVRQLRMTLGQIPIDSPRVVTRGAAQDASLAQALQHAGIEPAFDGLTPADTPEGVHPDLWAHARMRSQGTKSRVELLPKRVSRLQRAAERFSARRTRVILAAAVATLFIVLALFGVQQAQLSRLEKQWNSAEPKATEVGVLQDEVRKYRSWYDTSIPTLRMAKSIAVAFPEEGSVWLKAMQFKDRSTVTCTGSARSREDWMAVLENLRKDERIDDVQIVSTHGSSPFVFTMTLRWNGGDGSGK